MKPLLRQLKIKKLNHKAKLPVKGSPHSAGYDLCALEECVVKSKDKMLVSTGLSMAIPDGYYGRVAPRSGLACKNFIDVGAGVVDSDYRGEVKVLLFNFSNEDFLIKEGDRIAQLIVEKIGLTELVEVENLEETERNEGGFGSTGVN